MKLQSECCRFFGSGIVGVFKISKAMKLRCRDLILKPNELFLLHETVLSFQ